MIKGDVLLDEPQVSAKQLYDLLGACSRHYKIFCILYAALKIKLFDHLETLKNTDVLSEELGIASELTLILCEVLVSIGLLERQNRSFKNTKISDTYLKSNSLYYQHEVLNNIQGGFRLWDNLSEILRNGPIMINEYNIFQDNLIHALAAEILGGELQKTMDIIAEFPSFQKAKTLLDLGGGHGLYAIAFTRINPYLKAYVFDFPNVIKDTQAYINKFAAERVDVITGNLFTDDLGNGYDIIFFSYNPGGKNPDLVPKIHAALSDGGLFITKHAFYKRNEGSKGLLLDMEWNLTAFKGVKKGSKMYSFAGDLTYEDYLELLEKYFTLEKIAEANEFGGSRLSKFGDTLDSKIIIARKKSLY